MYVNKIKPYMEALLFTHIIDNIDETNSDKDSYYRN